ncbi:hypothetical protein [Anabaena sp. PCC 7108]|uniref:hypothetical protein n=1 Tax=Anabaena sp. PCC 7108 TaxID=163908 RepID=UPI00034DF3D4|nr:hypothetical protein [Anabaena sp. PCC 7108]
MINNLYSYDQALAIVELCSGLEFYLRHEADEKHIRVLGIDIVASILKKNHAERISMMKEVVKYL